MTDATEQIQYLHTLSQISRSCLDELTKENQKLKKENERLKRVISKALSSTLVSNMLAGGEWDDLESGEDATITRLTSDDKDAVIRIS